MNSNKRTRFILNEVIIMVLLTRLITSNIRQNIQVFKRTLNTSLIINKNFTFKNSSYLKNEDTQCLNNIDFSSLPTPFKNNYFWIKNHNENKYSIGITQKFIDEYNEPEYIETIADIDEILQKNDEMVMIENTKRVASIPCPFDNAKIICLNDLEVLIDLSSNPEDISNRMCFIEQLQE